MKIIVTGGCGFIGSHLVDRLIDEGHQVAVIDNLSTGKKENLNKRAVFNEYTLGSFKDEIQDDGTPVDVMFHLAALPRVGRSIDNPVETHNANVNGILEALEMAREFKIKKFIYGSSSSVYGDQKVLPVHEGLTPNPMNPYATQKLIGEEYCRIYKKVFGLDTVILRFFNVYGSRMATEGTYKLVFGNWIEQIKQNKRLTIYGDGKQTRDFNYIDDVVEGLIKTMEEDTQAVIEPINLCTGVETSVNQLAGYFNWGVEYIENPRPNEEFRKYGNNKRADALINWVPIMDIKKGIGLLREAYGI